MIDDTANLSIDFLAGFTIFIVAFIYVATLIPGLLLGVQSGTIDYNAVAYRTGVILVEDPGSPVSWENPSIYNNYYLQTNPYSTRFGLALSKDSPNILSVQKVNRFFCSTFVYPADYRSRAVFGDYPYLFNISLQFTGANTTESIGDILPEGGYGYIRRVVQLKGWSNATIGKSTITALQQYSTANHTSTHIFWIHLNSTELLDGTNPACTNLQYQINPWQDQIMINLSDLNTTYNPNFPLTQANLSAISIYRAQQSQPFPNPLPAPIDSFPPDNLTTHAIPIYLYIDGNSTPVSTLPQNVTNSLSLTFSPGFFYLMGSNTNSQYDTTTQIYVSLTFNLTQPNWYLNNTYSPDGYFDYNYTPMYVTQCGLTPGVMEISVW
jgi:hypothetical protein